MNAAWVIFRRARIILFSFLVFLCLTWAVLFALFLTHDRSHFSQYQKIVVACLLSLYGFTAILLYLMVVMRFHLWWDVARVVSLLVIHVGSSVVFSLYRSSFPCGGFDSEAFCKDFVFVIFIGCWVFSGMILCFSIVLGVMAFLPRPVDSLSGSGDAKFLPSPASFKAGSPGRPPSFHFISPYYGKSEYPDESFFPARTPVMANISAKTTITMTDSPEKPASVDVKSRRRQPDPLPLDLFSAPSPSSLPVYTSALEIGNESPSVSLSMPMRIPTIPKVMYGSRAMTSDSMYHDRAAPYTPTSYTDPSAHSSSATLRESHQPGHLYPDLVQPATPSVYSSHSASVSVHSTWGVSPSSHILPPPVLTADVAKHQSYGGDLGRRSYALPVTENSLQRRGSDGQVVDHAEWRQLVLRAASKP